MKNISLFLYSILEKKKDLPDDMLKKYMLILSISISTLIIHVLFVLLYFILGIWPLACFHLAGVGGFFISVLLLNKNKFDTAGLFITLVFAAVITLDDILVGVDNYFILYLVLLLTMTLVIPYSDKRIIAALSIGLPALMVGTYMFSLYHAPYYSLGDGAIGLSIFNILFASVLSIVVIRINRYVTKFINIFIEMQLEILQEQAYKDTLTQLYNRRYAESLFSQIQNENEPNMYCVSLVDIDDFKKVNDTYGHDAGDKTLQDIAQIMKNNLRKSDVVFRWGGEEFVLLLDQVDMDDAHNVLEKVRLAIEEHTVVYDPYAFNVTVTMGLASLDPQNTQQCLDLCDEKLYEGKRSGKNVVIV